MSPERVPHYDSTPETEISGGSSAGIPGAYATVPEVSDPAVSIRNIEIPPLESGVDTTVTGGDQLPSNPDTTSNQRLNSETDAIDVLLSADAKDGMLESSHESTQILREVPQGENTDPSGSETSTTTTTTPVTTTTTPTTTSSTTAPTTSSTTTTTTTPTTTTPTTTPTTTTTTTPVTTTTTSTATTTPATTTPSTTTASTIPITTTQSTTTSPPITTATVATTTVLPTTIRAATTEMIQTIHPAVVLPDHGNEIRADSGDVEIPTVFVDEGESPASFFFDVRQPSMDELQSRPVVILCTSIVGLLVLWLLSRFRSGRSRSGHAPRCCCAKLVSARKPTTSSMSGTAPVSVGIDSNTVQALRHQINMIHTELVKLKSEREAVDNELIETSTQILQSLGDQINRVSTPGADEPISSSQVLRDLTYDDLQNTQRVLPQVVEQPPAPAPHTTRVQPAHADPPVVATKPPVVIQSTSPPQVPSVQQAVPKSTAPPVVKEAAVAAPKMSALAAARMKREAEAAKAPAPQAASNPFGAQPAKGPFGR